MDKRTIFFGAKGLTSTSANHIANMAKEFIQVKSALVEHLRFVDRKLAVVAATPGMPMEVSNGQKEEDLQKIADAYDDIYRAKALIAWLREAIKARESMVCELRVMCLEEYCKLKEIDMPNAPKKEKEMTEDDYYATLSLSDRVRYYNLETKCAVLGGAIHPDGAFSEARKELVNSMAEPSKLVVKNGTTFVESVGPSVDSDVLDAFYFKLQNKHREAQAELNAIKFGCEKAIAEDNIVKATAYNTALSAYNARVAALTSEMDIYRKQRNAEISQLKIIVPESLVAIYEKINSLGK